jgi:hypothetical protein
LGRFNTDTELHFRGLHFFQASIVMVYAVIRPIPTANQQNQHSGINPFLVEEGLLWIDPYISSERLSELIVDRLGGIRGRRASWIVYGKGVGNIGWSEFNS